MRPKKRVVLISNDAALRFVLRNDTTFNVFAVDPCELDYQAIVDFKPLAIAIDERRRFPLDVSQFPTHDKEGNVVRLLCIGDGPGRYVELTATILEDLKNLTAIRRGPKSVNITDVVCKLIGPAR